MITNDRHSFIGIKQIIRLEWMQKTANLMLAGLDAEGIRHELDALVEERGVTSKNQIISILMNIWLTKDPRLILFRDNALALLREKPSEAFPLQWAMISACYPFWFNVARQIGRLLSLQNQATHAQIVSRVKEQYGDRETVSRYARYTIRSFHAWSVLNDTSTKGSYEKATPLSITNPTTAAILLESALLSSSEERASLSLLLSHPSFFPFSLPSLSGNLIARLNGHIDVVRYGLDDELLKLNS